MAYSSSAYRHSGPSSAQHKRGGSDDSWRLLSDKVRGIVMAQIEDELRSRDYSSDMGQEAATTVAERCMLQLREVTQDYKIIINSCVLQKVGAGLHVVSSCYWDSAHDGSTVIRWENSSIVCVVTVFGIKLEP